MNRERALIIIERLSDAINNANAEADRYSKIANALAVNLHYIKDSVETMDDTERRLGGVRSTLPDSIFS